MFFVRKGLVLISVINLPSLVKLVVVRYSAKPLRPRSLAPAPLLK